MRRWVKAGLIGGAVAAALNVGDLTSIVAVAAMTCFLSLLVYLTIGALAAHWLPPPRQPGSAARDGALAGGLAAAIGGLAYAIIAAVGAAIAGPDAPLAQLDPGTLQALRDAGVTPELLQVCAGPFGVFFGGSTCCLIFIVAGAVLGSLGGLVWAAMRPDA